MKEKITLTFVGRDSWSRPIYESNEIFYVDVDPRRDREPSIYTKYRNLFDGEPCDPVNTDFQFFPCRNVWY